VRSRRDAGLTALFLGFFASAWFGWAQADSTLRTWLLVGSIVSLVVAVFGAIVGFRRPSAKSAMHDRAKYRRYGIIVGIEFALAGIGAAALGIFAAAAYIPIWVCAVVGTSSHLPRFSTTRGCDLSGLHCCWSASPCSSSTWPRASRLVRSPVSAPACSCSAIRSWL
jgi:hypothetical protein